MGYHIGRRHVVACEPMSYRNYVIAAYCIFAIVLAWDFIVPRMQRRALLRAAKLRAARDTSRVTSTELNR